MTPCTYVFRIKSKNGYQPGFIDRCEKPSIVFYRSRARHQRSRLGLLYMGMISTDHHISLCLEHGTGEFKILEDDPNIIEISEEEYRVHEVIDS